MRLMIFQVLSDRRCRAVAEANLERGEQRGSLSFRRCHLGVKVEGALEVGLDGNPYGEN